MGELEHRQLGFRSVTEGLDTTTASGRLVFHIFGAIAESSASSSLSVARGGGRHGGRRTMMTEHKLRVAREMPAAGRHTMQEIADTIGVISTPSAHARRPQ